MEMKNTLTLQEGLLAKLLGFRKKKIYILYDIFTDYKLITIHYISISQIKKTFEDESSLSQEAVNSTDSPLKSAESFLLSPY